MLPVHLASGWLVAIAGLAARWPHPPSGSGPSPLPVAPSALASAGLNPEINKSGQNPSLPNLSHANRKLATLARLNARTPQTTGVTSNLTRVVQPLSKASSQAKHQDCNSGPLGPSSPDVDAPRSYLNERPKCALTAGTTNAVSHTTDAVAFHTTLDESSQQKPGSQASAHQAVLSPRGRHSKELPSKHNKKRTKATQCNDSQPVNPVTELNTLSRATFAKAPLSGLLLCTLLSSPIASACRAAVFMGTLPMIQAAPKRDTRVSKGKRGEAPPDNKERDVPPAPEDQTAAPTAAPAQDPATLTAPVQDPPGDPTQTEGTEPKELTDEDIANALDEEILEGVPGLDGPEDTESKPPPLPTQPDGTVTEPPPLPSQPDANPTSTSSAPPNTTPAEKGSDIPSPDPSHAPDPPQAPQGDAPALEPPVPQTKPEPSSSTPVPMQQDPTPPNEQTAQPMNPQPSIPQGMLPQGMIPPGPIDTQTLYAVMLSLTRKVHALETSTSAPPPGDPQEAKHLNEAIKAPRRESGPPPLERSTDGAASSSSDNGNTPDVTTRIMQEITADLIEDTTANKGKKKKADPSESPSYSPLNSPDGDSDPIPSGSSSDATPGKRFAAEHQHGKAHVTKAQKPNPGNEEDKQSRPPPHGPGSGWEERARSANMPAYSMWGFPPNTADVPTGGMPPPSHHPHQGSTPVAWGTATTAPPGSSLSGQSPATGGWGPHTAPQSQPADGSHTSMTPAWGSATPPPQGPEPSTQNPTEPPPNPFSQEPWLTGFVTIPHPSPAPDEFLSQFTVRPQGEALPVNVVHGLPLGFIHSTDQDWSPMDPYLIDYATYADPSVVLGLQMLFINGWVEMNNIGCEALFPNPFTKDVRDLLRNRGDADPSLKDWREKLWEVIHRYFMTTRAPIRALTQTVPDITLHPRILLFLRTIARYIAEHQLSYRDVRTALVRALYTIMCRKRQRKGLMFSLVRNFRRPPPDDDDRPPPRGGKGGWGSGGKGNSGGSGHSTGSSYGKGSSRGSSHGSHHHHHRGSSRTCSTSTPPPTSPSTGVGWPADHHRGRPIGIIASFATLTHAMYPFRGQNIKYPYRTWRGDIAYWESIWGDNGPPRAEPQSSTPYNPHPSPWDHPTNIQWRRGGYNRDYHHGDSSYSDHSGGRHQYHGRDRQDSSRHHVPTHPEFPHDDEEERRRQKRMKRATHPNLYDVWDEATEATTTTDSLPASMVCDAMERGPQRGSSTPMHVDALAETQSAPSTSSSHPQNPTASKSTTPQSPPLAFQAAEPEGETPTPMNIDSRPEHPSPGSATLLTPQNPSAPSSQPDQPPISNAQDQESTDRDVCSAMFTTGKATRQSPLQKQNLMSSPSTSQSMDDAIESFDLTATRETTCSVPPPADHHRVFPIGSLPQLRRRTGRNRTYLAAPKCANGTPHIGIGEADEWHKFLSGVSGQPFKKTDHRIPAILYIAEYYVTQETPPQSLCLNCFTHHLPNPCPDAPRPWHALILAAGKLPKSDPRHYEFSACPRCLTVHPPRHQLCRKA